MRLSSTGYLVAATSTASLVALAPGVETAAHDLDSLDFDQSLVAVATLLLVSLSAWSLVCMAFTLAANCAPGTATNTIVDVLAHLITPGFLRRALFLGAAGALAISPVAAVNDNDRDASSPAQSLTSQSLDGLRLPDRPLGAAPSTSASPQGDPRVVRVERGDTLWSIASRQLDPGASASEINAAVKNWYDANEPRIGPDPDLIFPGQQFAPPTKESP